MTTLFSNPAHNRLRRLTSYASIAVAGTLIVAKIAAYFKTGSVALLSSLVDSGVDMIASLITAYGIAHALRPADKEHRYGHGKAESLAALTQAAFILGSSILLTIEAIDRIVTPRQLENPNVGYAVMGLAIFLTAALLLLQTFTVRRTGSIAIASDRLHYTGDILINVAVIATFALQGSLGLPWIDPLFALVIAGSMVFGAVAIAKKALGILMDSELPESDRSLIKELALRAPGAIAVHDLRTRTDNDHPIVEIHVEMGPDISLRESHDIAEGVMNSIRTRFPGADIIVHQDPLGIEEKRIDHQIETNSAN